MSKGVVRMEPVRGNVIRENKVSGHKMKSRCIATGPGVNAGENYIGPNECEDYNMLATHPLGGK